MGMGGSLIAVADLAMDLGDLGPLEEWLAEVAVNDELAELARSFLENVNKGAQAIGNEKTDRKVDDLIANGNVTLTPMQDQRVRDTSPLLVTLRFALLMR
jgi:hypothetical protein